MALAISMMAVFWVWAAKTQTACAQATCPVALSRIISQGLVVNDDAADSDSRLEGDTNANLQYWDAGADAISLGAAVTSGAFTTVTGYTTNRAGVTSVGREYHAPAGTFTQTNAAITTLAVGARYFIGAPTFTGSNATQVLTDAFTWLVDAPAAGTNMTLTRAYTMGLSAGTTGTLWVSRDTDSTAAAGGLLFGLSRDTNLYRSAESVLRTDDDFTAANLTITSFAANWTNAGRTVADLGVVTTVDINGGTVGGVTLDGTISGTPTWASTQAMNISGSSGSIPNLTGPITSVGVATSIASQTGTTTTFVMQTSPTLITPVLGVATGTSLQAIIGNVTPAAGTFTALTGTSGSLTGLTGLAIRSTGAAYDLTFATATVFTAGRTLTIDPGDAARTITLSGNPTLADWFDQAVKTTSNPTFGNLTITSFAANWTNAGRTVADAGILTTVDINGGTCDACVIGGTSAAAGTFTTLTATGTLGVTGTATLGVTNAATTTIDYLGLGPTATSATTSAVMVAYGQYFANEFTATTTVSWADGNVQYVRLTSGAQTFTFNNPKAGARYLLILQQPASGAAATASWPAAVAWKDATAITLSTGNNDVDLVGCVFSGVTSNYYCAPSTNY